MVWVSRRGVLATGAALAVVPFSLWHSRAFAAGHSGARTRFDAESTEGTVMLGKFAHAIELMRARPTEDPLSWKFQWYTHWVPDNTTKDAEVARLPAQQQPLARELWNSCRAHDPSMDERLFLPWHRAYLFFFEHIARKVLGDENFALPYWDLTDPGKRALPKPFLQPAAVSNALYSPERKPEVNAGRPIDFQHNGHSPLTADALDQDSYAATDVTQGLCMALDKGVHASVHVLTGNNRGMGAVPWAANDPIFWLLHSDMDRLWESWVRSGRANPTGNDWLDAEFVFADEDGRRVVAHVRDFLDIEELGYRYDRLAPMVVMAGAAAPEAVEAPETAAAPSPPRARGGNRAMPPGAVGAAPPPALAQAAPAPQATSVLSHGPVRVGQAPVQVSLGSTPMPVQRPGAPAVGAAPPATAAPSGGGGGERAAAAPPLRAPVPRPNKLYIVIRNLQAKAQPGVLYDVYVKVTAPNGQSVTARLGSINFFDAVQNAAMPGMTMQQSFVSFEVTNTLALLRAPGAKLEVTIAPVGQAAGNAAPVIGNISLVEKPA